VTQPTLSVGIAKLEREVGAALFLRSNQRVQLTPAGSRFLTHARRIEAEFNLAVSAMAPAVEARVLRVGVLESVPSAMVAGALRRVGEDPVELIYGSESELMARLASGRADVALTLCERARERFLEQPLRRESYGMALPMGHRLAERSEVAAEELADEVMIVRRHCEVLAQTSRFFTDRGVRPRFALRSRNDERVLEMVAAGLGITLMPASFAHPGVTQVALMGFNQERVVGLVYARAAEHLRDEPTPFLRAFAEVERDATPA
jgi:DNA-binding transcriptional LysR family regulator